MGLIPLSHQFTDDVILLSSRAFFQIYVTVWKGEENQTQYLFLEQKAR